MANELCLGREFERLGNYQQWTDSIMSDLAYVIDSAIIDQAQTQLEQLLRNLGIPVDYGGWIASDVLHIEHTLKSLHEALCSLGLFELSEAVDLWHKRALESLNTQWDSPVLCCGPGAVEDIVLPADEFLENFGTSALIAEAETRNPGDIVDKEADVIAVLWQVARQRGKGLKPFVDNPRLRGKIENVFSSFDSPPKSQLLGGAQTIMASANRQICIETDIAWPYHPKQIADFGKDMPLLQVQRAFIRHGSQVQMLPFTSPDPRRPRRQSYILNLTHGMDIAGVQAVANDRVILRIRRYYTDNWKLSSATIKCSSGHEVRKPASWQAQEWPSLPLIGNVRVKSIGGTNLAMEFEAANETALNALACTYKRFIWTGLQTLDDPGWDQATRQILTTEVAHQFEVLSNAGSQIYVEISGVPKDPKLIKDIVAGKATCVGINQTELMQLTSKGTKQTNPVWIWPNPTQRPESLLERYQRGNCLANYLDTDVFIHGNECSLYLTRSQDEMRLMKIITAILVAKLAVISQLLDRAGGVPYVLQPSLAEKGFMALLQFAYDFARSCDDMSLLSQIVRDGYVCARNVAELSVAVVPVPWPYEVQQVNPTGAGDTIAGVVAALLPSQ